jgi:eukaryotic-like serine/threonine-protein kinase
MVMTIASTNSLLESLDRLQLLGPGQLDQLRRYQQFSSADPRSLAKQLVQCGWLTPFQVNRIFQGHGSELILGAYVLLEEIGSGAMGEVFKARHRTLDRIVALKVLRKDLAGNSEIAARFHREARAVANLTHRNIVQAFDADQADGVHFLAMEFVAGTDLGRLVQEGGPLPVAQACEVIRQAALGLDYAHSNGLIHRDIKPSNLLLVQAQGGPSLGLLKILDLGMARLKDLVHPRTASWLHGEVGSGSVTPITRSGNIIGTPDFMSPEQARNSHLVDGRADLYSLGCTFYTVLTGRMPFPGGTALDKLFRHQEEQATPVERIRPEIPEAVSAVVRKLMAKKPSDRFQTGGEAVAALAALLSHPAGTAPGRPRTQRERNTMVEGPAANKVTQPLRKPVIPAQTRKTQPAPVAASLKVAEQVAEPSGRSWLRWVCLVGLASVGAMASLSVIAYLLVRWFLGRP